MSTRNLAQRNPTNGCCARAVLAGLLAALCCGGCTGCGILLDRRSDATVSDQYKTDYHTLAATKRRQAELGRILGEVGELKGGEWHLAVGSLKSADARKQIDAHVAEWHDLSAQIKRTQRELDRNQEELRRRGIDVARLTQEAASTPYTTQTPHP